MTSLALVVHSGKLPLAGDLARGDHQCTTELGPHGAEPAALRLGELADHTTERSAGGTATIRARRTEQLPRILCGRRVDDELNRGSRLEVAAQLVWDQLVVQGARRPLVTGVDGEMIDERVDHRLVEPVPHSIGVRLATEQGDVERDAAIVRVGNRAVPDCHRPNRRRRRR